MLDVESLARHNAATVILMNDAVKAAEFMYKSVERGLASGDQEEKTAITKYVISIMEAVSEFDMKYADKIAAEYIRLLKRSMHP